MIEQLNMAIQLSVVGIMAWFAFWRRHFFLYIIAAAGLLVVGATYMDDYLALGLAIIVLGAYCLFRSAAILIGR